MTTQTDHVAQSLAVGEANNSKLETVTGRKIREIALDVGIAVATFVVLQLLGFPFWSRLLICFLSDYLRYLMGSFSSRTLLGSATAPPTSGESCETNQSLPQSGAEVRQRSSSDDTEESDDGALPIYQASNSRLGKTKNAAKITPFQSKPENDLPSMTKGPRLSTAEGQSEDAHGSRRHTRSLPSSKRKNKKTRGRKLSPDVHQRPSPNSAAQHSPGADAPDLPFARKQKGSGTSSPSRSPRRSSKSSKTTPKSKGSGKRSPKQRHPKQLVLKELLKIGDDSEFEDQMRNFQSRLQESASSPSDRRERRSAQLKTVIDPGTFAKLLASKKKNTRSARGF